MTLLKHFESGGHYIYHSFDTRKIYVLSAQFIDGLCMYLRKQLFPYAALSNWFLGAFAKFRKSVINFVVSVRLFVSFSAWNNSASTEYILVNFDI
jgi:hypothetical protein